MKVSLTVLRDKNSWDVDNVDYGIFMLPSDVSAVGFYNNIHNKNIWNSTHNIINASLLFKESDSIKIETNIEISNKILVISLILTQIYFM